jgi:hypothetical protein
MDNWLANIIDSVDSLYIEIDNLNDTLVRFCFISIYRYVVNCCIVHFFGRMNRCVHYTVGCIQDM